ncbi:MAG: DHA2 family efflux MFS transporter permease subunit [Alphaproteobacteria bacterium]
MPSSEVKNTHRGAITVCIMLATVMQVLDMTIANVALPHMQGSLSATLDQINWVLTSYIVASAIMTPPTGWLVARFGRKRLFVSAIVGFTLASALCGMATSLEQMILFRLLQGVCGASIVPLSQSVILDTYPKEKHGSAMALWGIGVMVGPILGPTLGGWLTEYYNWRWVFYINLPIGIFTVIGLSSFLHETKRNTQLTFDWVGFATLSLVLGALQMMLDRGEQLDWFASSEIVIEAILMGVSGYLFIVHIFTTEKPFIDPKMFWDRNFSMGLTFMFLVGIILLATIALMTPYLQNLMGYPVLTAGMVLAPRGIGTMLSMMVVGRLINRVDPRLMVFIGFSSIAFSLWQMSGFTPNVSFGKIVQTGVIQGLGLGLVFVPMSTMTFATLAPHYRAQATAIFSLMRNLGSSIGISLAIFLLGRNAQIMHANLAEGVTPFNFLFHQEAVRRFWDLTTVGGRMALNAEVSRQALVIAYADDFKLMMIIALAALPVLFLLRPPPRHRPAT